MKTTVVFFFLLNIFLVFGNETDLQDFTVANSLFTADLYGEITKNKAGNFLISPFSAQTVLALVYSGAKDKTAQEILTSLRLPNTKNETEAIIKSVLPTFQNNETYQLYTANKVYVREEFLIKDEFQFVAQDVYQADLENIDFTEKEKALDTINQWVETQTNNEIRDFIKSEDINDGTKLILINALYFKSDWLIPFQDYSTSNDSFYKENETVFVDTMHQTSTFQYYECEDLAAKFLELSFQGDNVSMVLVLPNEKDGIDNLERQISKVFDDKEFTEERVTVALPKFKIETTIDLTHILKQLGIKKAFLSDEADLSGIAGHKGDLVIDLVKQKTFIDVDEQGVEAAAASFVGILGGSGLGPRPQPKKFIVDHPFMFYIKIENLVLFAGRVLDPDE